MAKIKVKDLTSIIQDLSGHELDLRGGCVVRNIRFGGFVFTTGYCKPKLPKDLLF